MKIRWIVSGLLALTFVVAGATLRSTQDTSSQAQSVSTSPSRGLNGTAGVNAFGSPASRSPSLATAYQATDPTKPAIVTINLTSTANFSLSGGTTNTADVLIGATNGVAGGTGTIICKYANSITGTIAIGLNMNSQAAYTCTANVPIGWYWAIRQTGGTVTITSAFDQSVG